MFSKAVQESKQWTGTAYTGPRDLGRRGNGGSEATMTLEIQLAGEGKINVTDGTETKSVSFSEEGETFVFGYWRFTFEYGELTGVLEDPAQTGSAVLRRQPA
eukprot:TRINITY_DN76693_c0_g1_i1.p1 TRINITY_DN76693_c0_g1~~TRINITY_DN76693_c0_g1_i1.p1  ORF type:complete len:102 (+),score=9.33 TRINITY_DN76693_c0_g1_i1:63-368(+)